MNSNAMRGAVLVGVAVLIGALILGWGADDGDGTQVVTQEAVATVTPVPTVVAAAPVATATPTAPIGTTRDPSQVRIQVANAARIEGLAGQISARLGAQGYVTAAPTNAAETTVSTLYFELGYEADAQAVLAIFNSPNTQTFPMPNPRPEVDNPDTVDGGANIIMVVGSDDLSRS